MTRRLPRRAYVVIGRFSRTRFVQRYHPALYHRLHGAAFLGHSLGCLTILLHTTGARTGQPRTAALYAFSAAAPPPGAAAAIDPPGAARAPTADAGTPILAVIASNGGAGHPPAWWRNLLAHPDAVVEAGSRCWVVRAREAAGDERERLWRSINAVFPGYDDYQAVTPYAIPVVVLEPVPA